MWRRSRWIVGTSTRETASISSVRPWSSSALTLPPESIHAAIAAVSRFLKCRRTEPSAIGGAEDDEEASEYEFKVEAAEAAAAAAASSAEASLTDESFDEFAELAGVESDLRGIRGDLLQRDRALAELFASTVSAKEPIPSSRATVDEANRHVGFLCVTVY